MVSFLNRKSTFAGLALSAGLLAASPALAIKPYTLVEDGYPEPKGQVELENTFESTWHPRNEHNFKEFALENELEFQPTKDFALRFKGSYVYTDSADYTGLHFDAAGVEMQYYFTNPNIDSIGVSVIGFAGVSERSGLTTEAFLVLQKDWEKWTVTYNLGFGTDVDNFFGGGSKETGGTLINSLGAVYSLAPQLRVGGEISLESSFAEWRKFEGNSCYAGPVIHWVPNKDLWITAGFDFNLTGHADEPQYRFALIVGYYF